MRPYLLRLGVPMVLLTASVACGKAQARTRPEMPALPVHPLDVVAALEAPLALEARDVVALAAEPLEPAPGEGLPRPAEGRRAPEGPRGSEPAGAPPPAPASELEPGPPPPPTPLGTPETANEAQAERQVRDLVQRAQRSLARIRYERLSLDGRAQFDTARHLIEQAEDALRARNYVFALKVADKAATLARRLEG